MESRHHLVECWFRFGPGLFGTTTNGTRTLFHQTCAHQQRQRLRFIVILCVVLNNQFDCVLHRHVDIPMDTCMYAVRSRPKLKSISPHTRIFCLSPDKSKPNILRCFSLVIGYGQMHAFRNKLMFFYWTCELILT